MSDTEPCGKPLSLNGQIVECERPAGHDGLHEIRGEGLPGDRLSWDDGVRSMTVYPRALTAEEIEREYRSLLPPETP